MGFKMKAFVLITTAKILLVIFMVARIKYYDIEPDSTILNVQKRALKTWDTVADYIKQQKPRTLGKFASAREPRNVATSEFIEIRENEELPPYTFDDLYDSKFSYKSFYPNWVSESEYIYRDEDGIKKHNYDNDGPDIELVSNEFYLNTGANGYWISADELYIIVRTSYIKQWRYSYNASYAVYRISDEAKLFEITNDKVQYIKWSPKEHAIVYVLENDMYFINDVENASSVEYRMTSDGEKNKIYNGVPDWVYEEEMVSSTNNIFWSPSNQFLSYLVTNDTGVEVIEFTKYGETQYPETIVVAYPKAGETTPTVELRVYDTVYNTTVVIPEPTGQLGKDHIFCRLQWYSDSNAFLVFWLNRIQTKSVPQLCEYNNTAGTWACEVVEKGMEESSTGWIGVGGSPFRAILLDTSDRSYFGAFSYNGFFHIGLVNPETNTRTQKTSSTHGVIASLQRYDPTNGILHFVAAYPLPRQRFLYSISTNEANPIAETSWVSTVQQVEDRIERCKWNTPSFSQANKYMVINCGGPDVPMSVLYKQQTDGTYVEIDVVQNNDDLIANKAAVKWPTKEYETLTSKSGIDILYQVYKPQDFDPNKKYPMLIEVYGGPGYQKVLDRWTRGWAAVHMVSQYDIVVVMLDARGSGYRGDDIAHLLYKKIGQLEKLDTTEVAQVFAQKSWIDESRVALWGWSYGGYTTTFTISEGSGVFKCGFAVAPLATRFLYDSIHTERYMTLPDSNPVGYEKCSILNSNLTNFKKASYSIIHGTADDNVHFQNAALISKALIAEGVDFDNFYYADEDHGVSVGPNANKHIYRLLTRKVRTCFNLPPPSTTNTKSNTINTKISDPVFESMGYTKPECDQTKYFDDLF